MEAQTYYWDLLQYCCDAYVQILREHDISISMAKDHKPTDYAVAERVNGIIKTACVYRQRLFSDIDQERSVIGRYIRFFNGHRPHMSIGYKPPSLVHQGGGRPEKDVEAEKICRASFIIRRKQGIIAVPGDKSGRGPGPNG